MHDLDALYGKVPGPPEREGLPPGFRMRADAHYVEQLDSPPATSWRSVDINAIESALVSDSTPPAALVDSIRAHGVLQPLLVQHTGRAGRYRLIAGHQRLAAAKSAGLDEVPCMVHAVSDARAAELSLAARIGRPPQPSVIESAPAHTFAAAAANCTAALDAAVKGIAAAASLMSAASPVTRAGAAQLVGVECHRARRLLNVLQVLGGEYAIHRAAVGVAGLLQQVRASIEREHRALGAEISVHVSADAAMTVYGSEELLATAVGGAVAALTMVHDALPAPQVELTAGMDAAGSVAVDVRERGVSIPRRWADRAFDEPWPVADAGTAFALLCASREIARAHGGSVALHAGNDSTDVRFILPSRH